MRKALLLAAALVLCSAPARAQQSQALQAPTPTPATQVAEKPVAPSLHVSREQIDERVRQMEAERAGKNEQMGSRGWWYTVAAVAVGVIIALLLID